MGVFEDVSEQYPTLVWLLNDPEVGQLLRDAVDPNKGFSPSTFQAKLYQTNYWRTRSAKVREAEILEHTDPAEYQRRIDSYKAEIGLLANKLGIRLSDAELNYMGAINYREGVAPTDPQFTQRFLTWAKKQTHNRFDAGGTIQASKMQAMNIARNQFYIPLTEADATNWGIELALGTKDEVGLRQEMNQRAISLYPHLREQLQSGISMEDIFSGHRAVLARELEVDPASVDFIDQYRKVLHTIDPQTLQGRAMNLHETQTLARSEDKWWQTSKGKEMDAGMANFMLKMFGKRS